jgi:membrane-bound lytic murein transglycosylase A
MKVFSKLLTTSIILAFGLTWVYRLSPHSAPQPLMHASSFKELPYWSKVHHAKSLEVFQKSCQKILKTPTSTQMIFGTQTFTAQDWIPVCQEALKLNNQNPITAKNFFEQYFTPMYWKGSSPGLFTGYYAPEIEGRLKADRQFKYPIYATPKDLIFLNLKDFFENLPNKRLYGKILNQHFVAYDDRDKIYHGSLKQRAEVIAWVKNPLDSLELEIQGSGVIQTPEKRVILNYAAQNGHRYHAIGRSLIQEGKMRKTEVTFTSIRRYFEKHPQELHHFLIQNPSYVFFKVVSKFAFYGYQNIPLSPGYSLAVDPNYIPMGAPIFISTNLPNHQNFQRLMIAQDVGGAIKGPIRGDIYWGNGLKAKELASDMKQAGQMWYLVPKLTKIKRFVNVKSIV